MMDIVPFLGPAAVPEPTPFERFSMLRRDMVAAFVDWLRGQPEQDDVAAEIEGTTSVLESFRRIAAHDPSWLPPPSQTVEIRRGEP